MYCEVYYISKHLSRNQKNCGIPFWKMLTYFAAVVMPMDESYDMEVNLVIVELTYVAVVVTHVAVEVTRVVCWSDSLCCSVTHASVGFLHVALRVTSLDVEMTHIAVEVIRVTLRRG